MYPHLKQSYLPFYNSPLSPGTPIIVILKLLFYPETDQENNCNKKQVLLKIIVSTWSIYNQEEEETFNRSLPHLKRRSFWLLEITGNWNNKKHHLPPPFSNRCTIEISLPAMIYCTMTVSFFVFLNPPRIKCQESTIYSINTDLWLFVPRENSSKSQLRRNSRHLTQTVWLTTTIHFLVNFESGNEEDEERNN